MLIPWRVDVPEERLPFVNWLVIAGAVLVFVFQTLSIMERTEMLPEKMLQYQKTSVDDMAKEFSVDKKDFQKIAQEADRGKGYINSESIQGLQPDNLRDMFIKQAILEEYFVWGQIRPFILTGWTLKGFFGHIWLHGGILHLLGNMLFLWIFGNSVCAKIGNIKYFPIYIGLGLVAGFSQLVFGGEGSLGASGAINGIVGMFLIFFPINEITCYLFLPPIIIKPREFSLSSYWMILLWLVFDIWGALRGGGRIAYFAHLGGFAAGAMLASIMLEFKIVKMERYERSLLQLIDEYLHPPKVEEKPLYTGYLEMIQKQAQEPIQPTEPKTIPFEPKFISMDPPQISKQPPQIPLGPALIPPGLPQISIESPLAKPKDDFIRFACLCGKRLKMPSKFAGKKGKCPKCNASLRIPPE